MTKTIKRLIDYSIPVLASFAAIAAAVWGRGQRARADEYARIADEYVSVCINSCARCGQELEETVRAMGVSLEKLSVTASVGGRVLALEDVVRESAEAQALISRLPQSQPGSAELNAFLTRAGDYARSLSKRLLAGEEPGERDKKQLAQILDSCVKLTDRLSADIADGALPNGTEDLDYYGGPEAGAEEPSEPEYPELIYDGPFAEAVENAEPKWAVGEEAAPGEAQARAEELLGAPAELTGKTEGRLPTYDLTSGGAELALTVRGLKLLWFMRAPAGNASGLPDDAEREAIFGAARSFLDRAGYEDMEPSFAQYHDGTALVTFVWVMDGVRVYNDLVKVWIDRETHEPCGLDARNYVYSHCERERQEPAITAEEARRSVSQSLVSTAEPCLALIPITPQREALCYEFTGECGGSEYYVYVNAQTGREEQIFKILRDENGEKAV